ncbi:MAG: hypothetical protein ACE5GW_12435 [Planctomycetota bacterium]
MAAQCMPAEIAQLSASSGAEGDAFGHSVSVSGDVAVVGAPTDDDLGFASGSAIIYRRDPVTGAWYEEAQLLASTGAQSDRLGRSVSISGQEV